MSFSLCRIERVSERTSSQDFFSNEESAARSKPAGTTGLVEVDVQSWSHNCVVFRDRQNSSLRVSRRVALRVTSRFQ